MIYIDHVFLILYSKKGELLIKFKSVALVAILSIPAVSYSDIPANGTKSEVKVMKQRIFQVKSKDYSGVNESYYKHQLALTQAVLIKKDITLLILDVYRQYGMTRKYNDIYDAVDVSFESAFIFPELGIDHVERFIRIVSWAKAETNFKKNVVATWKKGQFIKSLNSHVKKDTSDHGMWQINIDNLDYSKKVNYLYNSGIITYKVNKISTLNDLMDIRTSCAVRCFIETDRKRMGMPWKHDKEKLFIGKMVKRIRDLEKEKVYDRNLLERYYHLIKIKTYGG